MLSHFTETKLTVQGGFNLGGINATGQIPEIGGNFGLIDRDTPREAYTRRTYLNEEEWVLVFSDEFNQDGRTFWPGDDPFWEAVDLHYWGTVSCHSVRPIPTSRIDELLRRTILNGMTLIKVSIPSIAKLSLISCSHVYSDNSGWCTADPAR